MKNSRISKLVVFVFFFILTLTVAALIPLRIHAQPEPQIAKIHLSNNTSLEETFSSLAANNIKPILFERKFLIGDQEFTDFYSVDVQAEPKKIKENWFKNYKGFLTVLEKEGQKDSSENEEMKNKNHE